MLGCSSKHEIKTAQIEQDKQDFSRLVLPTKPNFDLNASDENEAALLVWELYAYIKELENSLEACVGLWR